MNCDIDGQNSTFTANLLWCNEHGKPKMNCDIDRKDDEIANLEKALLDTRRRVDAQLQEIMLLRQHLREVHKCDPEKEAKP
jgi:hypothetical protein